MNYPPARQRSGRHAPEYGSYASAPTHTTQLLFARASMGRRPAPMWTLTLDRHLNAARMQDRRAWLKRLKLRMTPSVRSCSSLPFVLTPRRRPSFVTQRSSLTPGASVRRPSREVTGLAGLANTGLSGEAPCEARPRPLQPIVMRLVNRTTSRTLREGPSQLDPSAEPRSR